MESLSKKVRVPKGVKLEFYKVSAPIVKRSRLTSKENGGVDKDLSEGWVANYAVGCTHGCIFCYVDSFVKRSWSRYGNIVREEWGNYFLYPKNILEAIEQTPWYKWSGKEILLNSTHDPYLPQLAKITRKILERALPFGVRFDIQTRSPLVVRDLDFLKRYKDQVRIQVSIATLDDEFARLIEPRVAPPIRRLEIIQEARNRGFKTGVLVAPVFPPLPEIDYNPYYDVKNILMELENIKPDVVYGECFHIRGRNKRLIEKRLGVKVYYSPKFDREMKLFFEAYLERYKLNGKWWLEHRRRDNRG